MKQDYTQLDAAILAAIKDGFNSTGNILHSSSAGNMCCDMAEKCASGMKPACKRCASAAKSSSAALQGPGG